MIVDGKPLTLGDILLEKLVPEGTYLGRLKRIKKMDPDKEFNDEGERNWPYLHIVWVIREDGEHLGETVTQMMPLQPGQMFGLRNLCTIAGYDLAVRADEEFMEQELVDTEALLVVSQVPRKDGAGNRNQINKLLPTV